MKKVAMMQTRSNTAGSLLKNEIDSGLEIMTVLFQVFLESIQELNKDKEYFLEKLQNMNKIGETLGEYLKELNELTIEVNNTNKNNENYEESNLIDNTIQKLDRMTSVVGRLNSSVGSALDKRKKETMHKIRILNNNIIQIKKKLRQKKLTQPSAPKKPITEKIDIKKRF